MLQKTFSYDSYLNKISDNTFYQEIEILMNNHHFRHINKTYLSQWNDIEIFMLYIKLYEIIEDYFKPNNSKEIIMMIDYLMQNSITRKQLIEIFRNYQNNCIDIHQLLKKILKNNLKSLQFKKK
jgi:hypothetical protein